MRTVLVLIAMVISLVAAQTDCGGKPAEIFFLLDTSSSIWQVHYQKQLEFVKKVIDHFDIGPNRTRVGVAVFATQYYRMIDLNTFSDKKQLQNAVLKIPYIGGDTYTNVAIKNMREQGFNPKIVRKGVVRIGIILTDGRSRFADETREEAVKTKEIGINLFSIGIGDKVLRSELEVIGSSPKDNFVFEVASFDMLENLKRKLAIKACGVGPSEPPQGDEPACGRNRKGDVVFVFDSAAVGSNNVATLQNFIGEVVGDFNMAAGNMRAGVFSKNCHHGDISLNKHRNKHEFRKDLRNRDYPEFSHLIRKLRLHGFTQENGARPEANRMAVLFVDDKLQIPKKVFYEAARAKFLGIKMFVVAIGDTWVPAEVNRLATSKEHVVQVPSYENLQSEKLEFLKVFCRGL